LKNLGSGSISLGGNSELVEQIHPTTSRDGSERSQRMIDLFSEEARRDPYPMYEQMRSASPVLHVPPPSDLWMIFDYESVRRVVNDQDAFSSCVPAPDNWFIFFDPPQHTKMRALLSRAFTPKSITNLEPRIREFSRALLDKALVRGEIDLATEYSAPLPMMVIAEMIGIPVEDWSRFRQWSDTILKISYSMRGMEADPEAATAMTGFRSVTVEMNEYVGEMIAQRRVTPRDDLLTRLVEAEVDGERLTQHDILGFFQLLVVAGQETTANLINNAVLCLIENPDQLALLRLKPELLSSAIEEVLRYRSPIQWLMRTPGREIALNGQVIPAGNLMLAMLGSANRDPKAIPRAGSLRHPPRTQPAHCFRPWHSLLSRRGARANGVEDRAFRSPDAAEGFGTGDR
jgi:cytochrome P450